MIVDFDIHGLGQLVHGRLDLGDSPVPCIGWEVTFDAVPAMKVHGVEAHYDALGEQVLTLVLAYAPGSVGRETAQWIVGFLGRHEDLTAFSQVQMGGFCTCRLCR